MEEAGNVAFEVLEEYHITQEERNIKFYLQQGRDF